MKHKGKLIVAVIVIVVIIITVVTAVNLGGVPVGEMAAYLNGKYGYDVSAADCIYARAEDYSYHDGFLQGTTYDVPNIAIFEYEGEYITVTDRNGFFGDNAQYEELQELMTGYFEKLTGLEIAYVEAVRYDAVDNEKSLNSVLHHSFNEKLTEDNIDEFMDCFWGEEHSLTLLFYFYAEEDLEAQLNNVTLQLGTLNDDRQVESLRFYITDMDELEVYYLEPKALRQSMQENSRESDELYVWGSYHVGNDVEHHYSIGENAYWKELPGNTFVLGGDCVFRVNQNSGFGNRRVRLVNSFNVVSLSDAALEGYLEEMESYGEYHGYTILFRAGDKAEVSEMTIADGDKYQWRFRWGSGDVELYAFKHGSLLELRTAYECGYLLPEDMDEILEKHKDNFAKHHSWDYDAR